MVAVNSMDVRNNFKDFCDRVFQGETVIVSRRKNENVVMISEAQYNDFLKAKRNSEYLEKLDRSFKQLERGDVVVKTLDELESMADE